MKLSHYFEPVNFESYRKNTCNHWQFSLGGAIQKATEKLTDKKIDHIDLSIVGAPFEYENGQFISTEVPNLIRAQLYNLAGISGLNIVDYGNLKPSKSTKGTYLALRDIVDYLSENNIPVLIIGGSQDLSFGICQAFRNNPFFSFCSIDALLDIKKRQEISSPDNYLTRIFTRQPQIFQFSLIGYQSHYLPAAYFPKLKGLNYHIRLGILRHDLSLAEPVFRNSDFANIDFATLKYSDSFGKKRLPNGLQNDEICQLARYAGLSNRLKAFGLFGVYNHIPNADITIALAAQTAWYYIDGFAAQSKLHPSNETGFNIYHVQLSQIDAPLIFYKNKSTGQWWIKVQTYNNRFDYIACSEKDYIAATNDEIPDYWLKYVQKIDEFLK